MLLINVMHKYIPQCIQAAIKLRVEIMYTNLPRSFGYYKEIPLDVGFGFAVLTAGTRKNTANEILKLCSLEKAGHFEETNHPYLQGQSNLLSA
jgi:hypothetical protein